MIPMLYLENTIQLQHSFSMLSLISQTQKHDVQLMTSFFDSSKYHISASKKKDPNKA